VWHSPSPRPRSLPRRTRSPFAGRTSLECLEERQLLSAAEFELSSLLPANGGDGSRGFVVDGTVAGGRLGNPRLIYEKVGDLNQDGIDDLLLAAIGQNSSAATASDAYLIFGTAGGFPAELDLNSLHGTNGYVIHDSTGGDVMGFVGGGAGDLNHDGVNDLVLGALGATLSSDRSGAGQSFVFYGGSAHLAALDLADGTQDGRVATASLDGSSGFVINGVAARDGSGRSIGVGDINGDHMDDLIVGSHGPGGAGSIGHDYVIFGRDSAAGRVFPAVLELSTLDGSNGFVIPALVSSGTLSFGDPGRPGDINGDGINDLIVGDYAASPDGRTYAGQSYVIFGRPSFPATFSLASLNGSNGFIVNGAAAHDFLGYSGDGAGDLNGDGLNDLVIGAPIASNPSGVRSGAAYVVFGKTGAYPAAIEVSTLNGANGFTMYGNVANSNIGGTVAGAGDVNGDGFADVVIGASTGDPNGITDAGQSYVVYGRPSFAPSLNLDSLLAVSGGDGSAGFVINSFLASQNTRSAAIGDINGDGYADIRVGAETDDPNGLTDAGRAFIVYGKPSPPAITKFYVANDASSDRTYEYTATGSTVENYALNAGDTAPRGAASTAAGDRVWVVDANKNVYIYKTNGGLLGSWTAGSLASNATVEGVTTNGTDVWIVDARQDKVFRYTNAAGRLSGSQNAASSFNLNSGNTSPKDIVTDGTSLWVVNDSTTDKVFKYTLAGSLLGSWTITGAGSSPTGITLDPSGGGTLWTVDSGTGRVYQFDNARGLTSGSLSPSTSFALAAGNTNPQGIADPPMPAPGATRAAAFTTTSHPSAPLAAHLGRTIPGFWASKSTASSLPLMAATPSIPGPQATPIQIALTPSTDQDLALVATELLRIGAKRTRTAPRL
jgi:hypothetical protein